VKHLLLISVQLLSLAKNEKKLSIDEKIDALLCLQKGEKKFSISKQLGIPANTLSTWIKNKDKILDTYDCNNPE